MVTFFKERKMIDSLVITWPLTYTNTLKEQESICTTIVPELSDVDVPELSEPQKIIMVIYNFFIYKKCILLFNLVIY